MANNLVDNTNYGFTEGVPMDAANQEPLKKCALNSADLNTLTTPGFYSITYGNNTPPEPSGGIGGVGWFIVNIPSVFGGFKLMQFAISIGATSNGGVVIYGRERSDSGTWGSWKGVYQN